MPREQHVETPGDVGTSHTAGEEERLARVQQLYADLARVQRRIEEERCQIRLALFKPLLAILENLRRGITDTTDLRATLDEVLERLAALMEEQGVERISSVGKSFDPQVHEAVIAEERGVYSEWRVLEELEAGYRFRGRLIRPSKVHVVR